MYSRFLGCAAAVWIGLSAGHSWAGTTDCPLANEPYSTRSPIIDLMLSPGAKGILAERGFLKAVPERFQLTSVPGFGAILTLRTFAPKTEQSLADLDDLDKALAAVPVTREDRIARCARYDNDRIALPAPDDRPLILVFDKINGFRDGPSVDAATQALTAMAERRGWRLVFTDKAGVFKRRDLRRFDAVIWNNVSGDVLTNGQRAAFKAYIEHGGGFVGIHGAGGDPEYFWDWYADTLIGARFAGHPMSPQFQAADVQVADPQSPIVASRSPGWRMTEEWYSFKSNPGQTGAHVLLTLDEKSYNVPGYLTMGQHPITWTRCIAKGRSFYTAIGHRPENYAEPNSISVLENGIAWAAREGATQCTGGEEIPSQVPPKTR